MTRSWQMMPRAVKRLLETSSSRWDSGTAISSKVLALFSNLTHFCWANSVLGIGWCPTLSKGGSRRWCRYQLIASLTSRSHQPLLVLVKSPIMGSMSASQSEKSMGPLEAVHSASIGSGFAVRTDSVPDRSSPLSSTNFCWITCIPSKSFKTMVIVDGSSLWGSAASLGLWDRVESAGAWCTGFEPGAASFGAGGGGLAASLGTDTGGLTASFGTDCGGLAASLGSGASTSIFPWRWSPLCLELPWTSSLWSGGIPAEKDLSSNLWWSAASWGPSFGGLAASSLPGFWDSGVENFTGSSGFRTSKASRRVFKNRFSPINNWTCSRSSSFSWFRYGYVSDCSILPRILSSSCSRNKGRCSGKGCIGGWNAIGCCITPWANPG